MSQRFSLDRPEAWRILKVFLWSTASALVAALISLVPALSFPPQYVFLVPIVNTVLVALHQFLSSRQPPSS